MTEIDKMFENAGIESYCCKYAEYGYEGEEGTWFYCTKENKECWTYPQGDADCVEKDYPPFTAEKQLKMIKWLGSIKDYIVELDKFKGVYYVGCREAGSNNKHWGSHNLFEEALAELINNLWQSLTDQEKEEIRNILND